MRGEVVFLYKSNPCQRERERERGGEIPLLLTLRSQSNLSTLYFFVFLIYLFIVIFPQRLFSLSLLRISVTAFRSHLPHQV